MVTMGGFSKELCGGTHLDNTGEIDAFEVVSEEGVAAGTRRIVALTGAKAKENIEKTRAALREAAMALGVSPQELPHAVKSLAQQLRDLRKHLSSGSSQPAPAAKGEPKQAAVQPAGELSYSQVKQTLREAARALNVPPFEVATRIAALQAEIRDVGQQLEKLKTAGTLTADALLASAEDIGGAKIVVAEAPGANPNLMRQLIDQVRKKVSPSAVLLAAVEGDKVVLVAGVSRELVDKGVHAGQWVGAAAQACGGGGGGKPDMAQAGGKQPEKLPEALAAAKKKIAEMVK
jgi:alanyl-tRNA synthetase